MLLPAPPSPRERRTPERASRARQPLLPETPAVPWAHPSATAATSGPESASIRAAADVADCFSLLPPPPVLAQRHRVALSPPRPTPIRASAHAGTARLRMHAAATCSASVRAPYDDMVRVLEDGNARARRRPSVARRIVQGQPIQPPGTIEHHRAGSEGPCRPPALAPPPQHPAPRRNQPRRRPLVAQPRSCTKECLHRPAGPVSAWTGWPTP